MGFGSEGGYRQGGYGSRDRGGYGGGSYGGGGGFREAPVKVGEEYDLEITDVAKKGDGIGKVQGFIVFVAGARKGDKVHVRISQVRNRFAVGERTGDSQGSESGSMEASSDESMEEGEEEEGEEQAQ